MRKSSFWKKRIFAGALSLVLAAGLLSGCRYESIDDYLEDLGIMDPDVYGDIGSSDVPSEETSISFDWDSIKEYTTGEGEDEKSEGSDLSSNLNSLLGEDSQTSGEEKNETDGIGLTSDKAAADGNSSAGSDEPEDSSPSMGNGASSEDMPAAGNEQTTGSTASAAESSNGPDSGITAGYDNGQTPAAGNDSLSQNIGLQPGEPKSDEEYLAAREAIGMTDEGIAARKKQLEGLYAYERLTDSGKTLYTEILIALEQFGNDIWVSTTSDEALEAVYEHVMADHPEIFYVGGYNYINHTRGGEIKKITFTGSYIYSPEEVAARKKQIDAAAQACLADAPNSEDEYFAVKYVYDYLIRNTDYDETAEDNQNICSVFLQGRSVCNGYAKAAQYLLNKMGIGCTFVIGFVKNRGGEDSRHAWNLVRCNGTYYYMDVTWGDASYQIVSGETADISKLPEVNYDYLNVTTKELESTHSISDTIAMPVCTAMQDNYYVRENEYFTSADMNMVADLFDRRYKDGSNNVTLKCASDKVYDELFEELITNRKIFDFKQGDKGQVTYTTFVGTRTIIFWI